MMPRTWTMTLAVVVAGIATEGATAESPRFGSSPPPLTKRSMVAALDSPVSLTPGTQIPVTVTGTFSKR